MRQAHFGLSADILDAASCACARRDSTALSLITNTHLQHARPPVLTLDREALPERRVEVLAATREEKHFRRAA